MSKSGKTNKNKKCVKSHTVDMKNEDDSTPLMARQRAFSLKKDERVNKVEHPEHMRPRTFSMPSRYTLRKPLALQRYRGHVFGNGNDEDTYVVRSFEVTSKGIIKSRSDSLRSRSTASVSSEGDPCPFSQSSVFSGSSQESLNNCQTSENTRYCTIKVFGIGGVGKTALTQQFMTSEYLGGFNTSLGELFAVAINLNIQ